MDYFIAMTALWWYLFRTKRFENKEETMRDTILAVFICFFLVYTTVAAYPKIKSGWAELRTDLGFTE
jgi:hypothetical protein